MSRDRREGRTVEFRARLAGEFIPGAELESTHQTVHLSRYVSGTRYTLRGIPASRVDVVVCERRDPRDVPVLEHVRKRGRYDGAERDRLTLRYYPTHQANGLVEVELDYDSLGSDEPVELIITRTDTREVLLLRDYPRLRSELEGYQLARIVMWHWRRYYCHLTDGDEIRVLADSWAAEHSDERWTLAEANRSASRLLYRHSRDLGWRKLTARERAKYHAHTQWVRQEWVAEQIGLAHASGTGQYTRDAAHGEAAQ